MLRFQASGLGVEKLAERRRRRKPVAHRKPRRPGRPRPGRRAPSPGLCRTGFGRSGGEGTRPYVVRGGSGSVSRWRTAELARPLASELRSRGT